MGPFRVASVLLVALASFVVASSAADTESKHWAVLVAGSSGWMNYRHQADVCHAYQILHQHGIPDERIIVMMVDDIAHNEQNPDPGVIINRPNGTNVYAGVPKDYTGKDVNPDNFFNVLLGNKTAMNGIGSGKVLESGPNDHVFINFVDHGAPGFIAFPVDMVSARNLNLALKRMKERKMFKQLVFYLEACESGSMFDHNQLANDSSVYAVTAANGEESSWAIYFDKHLSSYLGDYFSVKWMENVDKVGTQEDLFSQFHVVREEVTTSHVMKFGDMSFDLEALQEFVGGKEGNAVESQLAAAASQGSPVHDAVPSPDVTVATLYHRMMAAATTAEKEKQRTLLYEELALRNKISKVTKRIVATAGPANGAHTKAILTSKAHPRNFDCLEPVVAAYSKKCFSVSKVEFAIRQVGPLANMCEHESFSTKAILSAIDAVCQ